MGISETEQMIENFSKQYYEKIFYFSLKKTSNRSEAEDLTSDIALDIIAALRKGIIPEYFSAYVWKAARNRYSKWTAKKSRSKESLSGEDFYNAEYADCFDIEEEYIKKEEINTLRREISLVSKEYREIMLAFYIDDKKVSQISKELGLPGGGRKERDT